MLPTVGGGDTPKVRLNADGTRTVVANVPDGAGRRQNLSADTRGQNLYWLKKQRPELWHAQAAARHAHSVQTGQTAPSASSKITVPGFQDFCPGWLMKPTTEEFIETSTMQHYQYDVISSKYFRLQQGVDRDKDLSVLAEGSTSSDSSDAPPCRKVLIADLHRAASVLNFDISHHDRPAAVFTVFDTNGASSVIEAAAKGFHTFLLPMLASMRGDWSPVDYKAALTTSLHQSLGAVEDPSVASSVSAAAALLLGSRLTTIAFGPGARCVVSAALQDPLPGPRVLSVHSSGPGRTPAIVRDLIRPPGSSASSGAAKVPSRPLLSPALPSALILAVSEAKGAPGSPGSLPRVAAAARESQQLGSVTACFDLDYGGQFQCLTLMANAAGSLTGLLDEDVAPITEEAVAHRRPRAGCRMLLNAARAKNAKSSMVAAMVNFVWSPSPEPGPPALKRPKTDAQDKTRTKVRVRHILLRHAACAAPQDPVRHQKVTRSLEEAEVQLLAVLQELDRDATQFNTKCREISECETSMKGGDFAGDLGWLSREKSQTTVPEVHKAAFSLNLGQMSDLVASKIGLHIVMRTA